MLATPTNLWSSEHGCTRSGLPPTPFITRFVWQEARSGDGVSALGGGAGAGAPVIAPWADDFQVGGSRAAVWPPSLIQPLSGPQSARGRALS
jgi:hypothetical protein